jgi:hypothetical protein
MHLGHLVYNCITVVVPTTNILSRPSRLSRLVLNFENPFILQQLSIFEFYPFGNKPYLFPIVLPSLFLQTPSAMLYSSADNEPDIWLAEHSIFITSSESHMRIWTYYLQSATERPSACCFTRCLHNLLNILVQIAKEIGVMFSVVNVLATLFCRRNCRHQLNFSLHM